MWPSARLWLKVILGFLFSISTILCAATYGLFGATASDTVELVVTEATGLQGQETLFIAQMQPLVIHNIFWLSLAAIGFFLIFLYFADHSYRVFLAPGVLCLAITLLINIVLWVLTSHAPAYTGESEAVFVLASLGRVRQAGYGIAILGALLIFLSYWMTGKKIKAAANGS